MTARAQKQENLGPRAATPPGWQAGTQLLASLPGSGTVDICEEGLVVGVSPQRTTVHLRWRSCTGSQGWTREGKITAHIWEKCAHKHLVTLKQLGPGRAQDVGPIESVPLWRH